MVLFFVYIPVIMNIGYSFFRLSSYSAGQTFVGLDNYRRFFTDSTLPIMLKNNIAYCVISLIVQVGMKTKKSIPYLYMLPGVFMVLFFVYIPVIMNIGYSFFRLSSYSAGQTFVGLDNYRRFFTDSTLPIMLKNNIAYCVISLIVQVGFGTVIALILESDAISYKLKPIFRNIYYIPALISLTAVGLMFTFIYEPNVGLLNNILKALGKGPLGFLGDSKMAIYCIIAMSQWQFTMFTFIYEPNVGLLNNILKALGKGPLGFLGDSKMAIYCIIAMSQWQFTGYITLLMVVAFQNVPREYLEAASIDGAGPVKRALLIMLPQAKEQLLVCSIITIIGAFKLYTEVYATTSGGPGNSSQVLGLFLYQQAFLHDDLGMAAVTGVFIFVITVTLSIIQIRMTNSGKE